jgi:hypothetical protein
LFPGRVDALVEVDKEIPTVVGRGRGRCRDRVDAVEKLDTRSKRFRLDLRYALSSSGNDSGMVPLAYNTISTVFQEIQPTVNINIVITPEFWGHTMDMDKTSPFLIPNPVVEPYLLLPSPTPFPDIPNWEIVKNGSTK